MNLGQLLGNLLGLLAKRVAGCNLLREIYDPRQQENYYYTEYKNHPELCGCVLILGAIVAVISRLPTQGAICSIVATKIARNSSSIEICIKIGYLGKLVVNNNKLTAAERTVCFGWLDLTALLRAIIVIYGLLALLRLLGCLGSGRLGFWARAFEVLTAVQ